MQQKAEPQTGNQQQPTDAPLLDLSDAAVKKMIKTAKTRGFVTYDELNAVLPSDEVSSEQIEDIMSMLSEMGINVVENEEDEAEEEEGESRALTAQNLPTKAETKSEPSERTDDPVRMYLREMGTVELLSREGEIAIAKRIEAGHEAMIAGLCESPLTFQAIIIWRDELNEGRVLLRDIIDLEATYEGPEAKAAPPPVPANQDGEAPAAAANAEDQTNGEKKPPPKAKTPAKMTTRTTTITKTPSHSLQWKQNSSLKSLRPSTQSPRITQSCVNSKTRSLSNS